MFRDGRCAVAERKESVQFTETVRSVLTPTSSHSRLAQPVYWRQESRKACATSMPPAPNGCSETLTRPRLNVVAECSSTAIGVPPGNHNAACLPVVFYLSSRRCRGALSGHHSHASLAHASTLHLRHCLSKPLASSTPSSPTRHPPVRHSLHQIQLDLASQRAPR